MKRGNERITLNKADNFKRVLRERERKEYKEKENLKNFEKEQHQRERRKTNLGCSAIYILSMIVVKQPLLLILMSF